MKEKLLQAEQQLAKSKHDLALKAMEAEGIRAELNKAWVKLDEVGLFAIKVERCIDGLQEEIREASLAWSELEGHISKLEGCVSELTEDAKVASEKAIEEYKKSEAFRDEVTESTLDIFLFGFDECKKQIGFLHPDLELEKL